MDTNKTMGRPKKYQSDGDRLEARKKQLQEASRRYRESHKVEKQEQNRVYYSSHRDVLLAKAKENHLMGHVLV